ncbi:hypothetical protein [Paraherbaspirillum soli]|uniref:Uncharacterized protein n=1 Tax=Paraherbaspirillum soli TaxID=631222 RepID=A0ABW0M6A3_9BURK
MLAVLQYGCASRPDLGPLATVSKGDHKTIEGNSNFSIKYGNFDQLGWSVLTWLAATGYPRLACRQRNGNARMSYLKTTMPVQPAILG